MFIDALRSSTHSSSFRNHCGPCLLSSRRRATSPRTNKDSSGTHPAVLSPRLRHVMHRSIYIHPLPISTEVVRCVRAPVSCVSNSPLMRFSVILSLARSDPASLCAPLAYCLTYETLHYDRPDAGMCCRFSECADVSIRTPWRLSDEY